MLTLSKNKVSLLTLSSIFAALFVVVFVVGFINQRESTNVQRDAALDPNPLTVRPVNNFTGIENVAKKVDLPIERLLELPCVRYSYIDVEAMLISVDVLRRTYRVKVRIVPCGEFVDLNLVSFGKGTVLGSNVSLIWEHTGTFDKGIVMAYPTDSYTALDLFVQANFFNATAGAMQDIPIHFSLKSILPR
ncbi:hypothetical protein HDU96_008720 [Phlyctochytrium bullatum]|nr:hypothetical protein HDU96_008720 [Phlyctochytrium bullatum]